MLPNHKTKSISRYTQRLAVFSASILFTFPILFLPISPVHASVLSVIPAQAGIQESSLASIVSSLQSILLSLKQLITASYHKLPSVSPTIQLAQISGANSGLVAHYTFDEGSGTMAGDSSGNGNTGTLTPTTGGPTWVTGTDAKVGSGAMSFDGVNDYVNIGAPASLNLTSDYTLSVWVKVGGFAGGLIRQSNNSSNGAQFDKYSLRPLSATSFIFATGDGTTGDSDSFNFNMTLGTWTMVTCTLSSSNVKSCYKNGALVGTATNDVDTSLVTPTLGFIGGLMDKKCC